MTEEANVDRAARQIARALVEQCVRKTRLEDLHAGKVPDNVSGDFSDVKVVTPLGVIPCTNVSRLSDAEMKALMVEVVNRVGLYLLTHVDDLLALKGSARWGGPELDTALKKPRQSAQARAKKRG